MKKKSYKKQVPLKKFNDIKGQSSPDYIYVRGKNFEPNPLFRSVLRIGILGLLIIIFINAFNVYFRGKSLQDSITGGAQEGIQYLIEAGDTASKTNFEKAFVAFKQAEENFEGAESDLWFVNLDHSSFNDEDITASVTALLESGKHFSNAGGYFLEAVESFNAVPQFFVEKNTSKSEIDESIEELLGPGLDKMTLAINQINLAVEKINQVKVNDLPRDMRDRFIAAKSSIENIADTLKQASGHFPGLMKLLGDRLPHRYLILFQNNNEIRPTGGFIGSYAIIDVNDGVIEKLEVNDVYDLDGSFHEVIEPPDEFRAFTNNWRFRDANYSSDFSVSATKLKWFLEKEGGPTVDTVIAINQGLLKDMLEITGPIQVGDFGELNSENYNLLLSYVIEGKVWGAEDPKHILKVFIPAFKEAILKEENISAITTKLYNAIQQKHIMAYSSDDDIQGLIESINADGEVNPPDEGEDYFSLINISTGGTKSEPFIEEEIKHHTDIGKHGKLVDTVRIKRSHMWSDSVYVEWKKTLAQYGFTAMPDQLIDTLGRGRNRVNMRIYVPTNSELLESTDPDLLLKYDKDLKMDYFYSTMDIKAGESKELVIKYQLPFTLDLKPAGNYRLLVEKQPGSVGSIFTKTISGEKGLKNIDQYPENFATNLVYDRYFSSIWKK